MWRSQKLDEAAPDAAPDAAAEAGKTDTMLVVVQIIAAVLKLIAAISLKRDADERAAVKKAAEERVAKLSGVAARDADRTRRADPAGGGRQKLVGGAAKDPEEEEQRAWLA